LIASGIYLEGVENMSEERGAVDAETKLYMKEMKESIIEAVRAIVKENSTTLEAHMTKVTDLRFNSLDEKVKLHAKYHDDHYQDIKDIRAGCPMIHAGIMKEVDAKIEPLAKTVAGLDRRQSTDEGFAVATNAIKNMSVQKLGVIIAGVVAVGGLLGWIANHLIGG